MHTPMRLKPATVARWTLLAGVLAVLGGLPARPALAQGKTHCGEVSGNETWQSGDNPHMVTCDVVVRGSTLTLAPGTNIQMNQGTSLIVEAGAGLIAPGNAMVSEPVQILPIDRTLTAGFWGQVLIKAGAAASALSDVQIKGGGRGGKPMLEVHAPIPMFRMQLQFAEAFPIALDADALGLSLEPSGSARAACGSTDHPFQLSRNGVNAIQVLATDTPGGDVVTAQSWYNLCAPYHALSPLTIGGPEAPSLTLQPGVVLKFGPGAGLTAGLDAENPGQFEASGGIGAGETVLLTGLTTTPGSWDGITFSEFSDPAGLGNSLFNTRLEYGGEGGRAMLRIHTPAVAALDSVFAQAAGYPVEARPDAVDGFVSGLWSGGPPPFVSNGIQRIHVLAAATPVDIPGTAAWRNPGVPFEVDGDFLVAGRSGGASLTIEGGTTLVFRDGAELVVGDTAQGSGALTTRGTRQSPVLLTNLSAQPGAWKGVTLTDEAKSAELAGVRIEYGGQGQRAMLEWGDVPGLLTESTLRGAPGHPLAIALTRVAAVIGEAQLDELRRNTYADNGVNRVLARVNGPYAERLATWADPGVPVELDGAAVVGRAGGGSLSMHGGLRLLFPAGKGLQIGDGNARATVTLARESAGERVVLGPVDPQTGWSGLKVPKGGALDGAGLRVEAADEANLAVSGGVLKLGDVELLGRAGGASIGLDISGADSRVELEDGRITDHRIGVRTRSGAHLELTRSVVSGNREWGVQNEDPTVCVLATLVYWGDPSGPKDASEGGDPSCLEGAWNGDGDKVSDHVKWWRYAINTAFDPATGLGPNPLVVFLPTGLNQASGR